MSIHKVSGKKIKRKTNYIIFDMEWNELMPYQLDRQNKIGFPLSGEIIEIGAVRMDYQGNIRDSYSTLVRPSFIDRMHPHVERLTGISLDMLQKERRFPEVAEEFHQWCGSHAVLLSWGTSDRQVLAENLRLHNLPRHWVRPWFDAQILFGRFCLDEYEQYGLARACEYMGIEMDDEDAHRAVNDAMYTAKICSRIPFARGVRDYSYHGAIGPLEFRPTVAYYCFDGYRNRNDIWKDPAVTDIYIEKTDSHLALTEPERYRRNTTVALGMDRTGKRYLVRWKVYQYFQRKKKVFAVGREVYRAVPELIYWYREISKQNRNRRIKHRANRNPTFRD